MRRYARHLILALIAIISSGATLTLRAEVLDAQWQVYQIRFNYNGLTTNYTCDGIERKLKRLLKILGARNDVRVESNCIDTHNLRNPSVRRVRRAHRLKLAFAMPIPADKTDLSREIIPAEWQETRVTGNLSRYLDAADCELLEQFQRYILPRLQVQSVSKSLYCSTQRRDNTAMGKYRTLRVRMIALKAIEKTELEVEHNN